MYAAVSNDEYELIAFMAETQAELGRQIGLSRYAVNKAIKRRSAVCKGLYKIIYIEEDDNDSAVK